MAKHILKVDDEITVDNQCFKVISSNSVISIVPTAFCAVGDFITTYKTTTSKTGNYVTSATTILRYLITNLPAPVDGLDASKGTPYMLLNIDSNVFLSVYIYANEMSYTDLLTVLNCDKIVNNGKFTALNITSAIK